MAIEKDAFEAALRRPPLEEAGQEERLDPALGQLPLEEIISANEDVVDEMIVKRHSLYPQYLFRKKVENPLVLKRIVLARLEGIDLGTLVTRATELGSNIHTSKSLEVVMSRALEPTVVERIEKNGEMYIRLAAIQSDPELQALVKDICEKTDLSLEELFDAVPQYKKEAHRKSKFPIQIVIEAYRLAWGGSQWTEISEELNTSPKYREINPGSVPIDGTSLRNAVLYSFSKRATDKLPQSQVRPPTSEV